MSAELYQNISIVAFVLAAIFLLVAVILFFTFDIPAVLGELSGKTAAKQVAEIRAANKNAVAKRRKVSTSASTTQRATGKLKQNKTNQLTKINQTNKIDETELLQPETEMLVEDTTLLSPETTLLNEETTLLSPETTLLGAEEVVFEMLQDIEVVHTKEII